MTTNITPRKALTAAVERDQAFVTLWNRRRHLGLEGDRLLKVDKGQAADAVSERIIEIEDRIADRPAASHVGLAIKRQLAFALEPPREQSLACRILAGALADAERLAGRLS